MPQNTFDYSTLVQVMACCHQAASHYLYQFWSRSTSHDLGQCWPRSVSLYDITKPQWVNLIKIPYTSHHCGRAIRCLSCILQKLTMGAQSIFPMSIEYNTMKCMSPSNLSYHCGRGCWCQDSDMHGLDWGNVLFWSICDGFAIIPIKYNLE